MNKENLWNINGSLEEHNWDKGSTNSDVSANTDMKVFHVAICSKDDVIGKLNKKKDTATNSMVTFLVINTSGVTIIPTTIISLRMMYDSISPTSIVLPCILSTFLSLIGGIIIDKILIRRCKYK